MHLEHLETRLANTFELFQRQDDMHGVLACYMLKSLCTEPIHFYFASFCVWLQKKVGLCSQK